VITIARVLLRGNSWKSNPNTFTYDSHPKSCNWQWIDVGSERQKSRGKKKEVIVRQWCCARCYRSRALSVVTFKTTALIYASVCGKKVCMSWLESVELDNAIHKYSGHPNNFTLILWKNTRVAQHFIHPGMIHFVIPYDLFLLYIALYICLLHDTSCRECPKPSYPWSGDLYRYVSCYLSLAMSTFSFLYVVSMENLSIWRSNRARHVLLLTLFTKRVSFQWSISLAWAHVVTTNHWRSLLIENIDVDVSTRDMSSTTLTKTPHSVEMVVMDVRNNVCNNIGHSREPMTSAPKMSKETYLQTVHYCRRRYLSVFVHIQPHCVWYIPVLIDVLKNT